MSDDNRDDEARPGAHTLTITENLALFGGAPDRGEPDYREVWDEDHSLAALDEAMRIVVQGVTVDGTQMADEREQLMWGFVNIMHAQIQRLDGARDRIVPDIRDLIHAQDGSEVKANQLETLTERARNLGDRSQAFEKMRDRAAAAYLAETGSRWHPRRGSLVSRTGHRAHARIDSRDYARAREKREIAAATPDGALVALAGGKDLPDPKTVWAELDRALEQNPDMVLVHGDAPGVEKTGAAWAEARNVKQVPFAPDWDAHGNAAPFRRNQEMLKLPLDRLIAFSGSGITDNLVDRARKAGIPVDRPSLTPALSAARPSQAPAQRRLPTVLNLKDHPDAVKNGAIRIDRETRWGNPFRIGEHGSREEVTALYRKDLWKRIRSGDLALADLAALNGKDLACAAGDCHGEILAGAAIYAAGKVARETTRQASLSEHDRARQQPIRTAPAATTLDRASPSPATRQPAPQRMQSKPDHAPRESAGIETDGPDRREVWDREDTLAALDEAMRVLVRDVTVEGTQLADEREQLMWGVANMLNAQAQRLDRDATRMERDMAGLSPGAERDLLAGRIGNLRERSNAFAQMHDRAAQAYFAETLKEWTPRHRAQATHTTIRTQTAREAEAYLRDLEKRDVAAHAPDGTLVALTGGKTVTDPDAVWSELDRARDRHPDMILLHGDAPGVQKIGARWAEANDVAQVLCLPDWKRHPKAAPYRRNDQIVALQPKELIAFPGTGVIANLVDKAREAGIPVTEASLTRTLSPAEPSRQTNVIDLADHRDAIKNSAIPIGSETRWANPFTIGEDGNREQVTALYRNDLWKRMRSGDVKLADLAALNGKDLACAAGDCHAEVLAGAAIYAAGKLERQATEPLSAPAHDHARQAPADSPSPEAGPTISAPETPSATNASQYWADVHNFMERREQGEIQADAARIDPDHLANREQYVQDARYLLDHPLAERLSEHQRQHLSAVVQDTSRHDAIHGTSPAATQSQAAPSSDPADPSPAPALTPTPTPTQHAAVTASTPETPSPMHASESFAARLQTFMDDHKQRNLRADRSSIDRVLLPGLEQHAAAARELLANPQSQHIPAIQSLALKEVVADHERREHASTAITNTCGDMEPALARHRHLDNIAAIRDVKIWELEDHRQWYPAAYEISARANDILQEPDVYDCGFTPENWDEFRENLLDLDTALGNDTFFTLNGDLLLPPLPHARDGSEEALKAQASYRHTRTAWHEHLVSAHEYDPHPCEHVSSKIFNAMERLKDDPTLTDDARRAMSDNVADYNAYCCARSDVETFFQDTDRAIDANRSFKQDIKSLDSQNPAAEDIEGYAAWKEITANLQKTGEEMFSNTSTAYGPYLKHHPDLKERLEHCLDDLDEALDRALPSRTQEITQSQQIDQHRAVSRGMRM